MSLQKLFSFLEYTNFKILESCVLPSHQMPNYEKDKFS